MAKIKRKRFIVEGSGVFPYDMLRYDACWPETESQDSYKLCRDAAGEFRRVALLTDSESAPTVGRWRSFTWRVVETEVV